MVDARVRCDSQDVGERIKSDLHELLGDSNALGDKLLMRLVNPEKKDDEKVDPKATVTKEQFIANFYNATQDALGFHNLLESAQAQFNSFLEMELRQIPHRVIEKLEAEADAAEGADGAAAGGAAAPAAAAGSDKKESS